MALVMCVMGESGSGKTTAMRNLDPATTLYIDCDKKGLSWRGWKAKWNGANRNYIVTDYPQIALQAMMKVNEDSRFGHIKTVVVDTLNGLMVADEMRRSKEKGYDKWLDLAVSIYGIVDYALTMRDGVTVIFLAHTQTEHDEGGYIFTRIKTNGRKLDKITLESKFGTVLWAKKMDGRYVLETQANNSTAKSPMGALDEFHIDNDIVEVIRRMEEYENEAV